MRLTLGDIAEWTGGRVLPPSAAEVVVRGVAIDSRRLGADVSAGELFVALRGEGRDGHDFVAAARRAGAAAALVARHVDCDLPQVALPADAGTVDAGATAFNDDPVLAGLWALARGWRGRHAAARVAAITGSNGKTTVKEMLAKIAAAEYGAEAVLASEGNFNNHLGVPLTLLRLNDTHKVAVIEAGMDNAGELTALSGLISPQVAVINNAQRAHIGHFESVAAIARAKGELLSGVAADGVCVLNADDPHFPLWRELAGARQVLSFGAAGEWRARATDDGIELGGERIALRALGEHNKLNAIAASAAAHALGISARAILDGLRAFVPVLGRMRVARRGEVLLIDDTYNANPDSAAAAVQVLSAVAQKGMLQKSPDLHGGGERLAALSRACTARMAGEDACHSKGSAGRTALLVMGDMLALGEHSGDAHGELARRCAESGVQLFGVGAAMGEAIRALDVGRHFGDDSAAAAAGIADAVAEMAETQLPMCVLVKGSRGMKMEVVLAAIEKQLEARQAQEGGAPC